MAAVASDLRAMVEGVRIDSAASFTIAGDRLEVEDGGTLVDALAEALYQRRYIRPRSVQPGPEGRRSDDLARRQHVADLSLANQSSGTWEPGWSIDHVEDDGMIAVVKDQLVLWALPSQIRPRRGEIAAGELCRLRVPGELLQEVPGFYVAIGNTDAPWDRSGSSLRLYWHLSSAAAVTWVEEMTTAFNAGGIPFRLKTLSDPTDYRRADAGVLYLSVATYVAGQEAIRQVYRRLASGLRTETPRLTAELAPGLAWSQGPDGGGSFGEHRCRLIAGAMVEAFERRRRPATDLSLDECLRAVASAFKEVGLDPRHPHLAAGSTKNVPPLFGRRVAVPENSVIASAEVGGATATVEGSSSLLEAARGLGERLCRQAWWHRDRCNWIGHREARSPTVAALGPDLYAGTAGVGCFLAELYRLTGDDSHRQTAAGALRRALASLPHDLEELPQLAFFSGRLGVAWAARRGALLLGDDDLESGAERLLESLLGCLSGEQELDVSSGQVFDVIDGHAGAILALVNWYRETREPRCLDAAEVLGEEICLAAEIDGDAWSWPNQRLSGIETERPLTGFSHGVAGVGLALLELFAATGRKSFLTAATGAFVYEDALFDIGVGNWPDFRKAGETSSFMTAWCHGAPGIALSRLVAMVIDPERAVTYETAAQAGIDTTARFLQDVSAEPDVDISLCHGLSGLADILLIAAEVLGKPELRHLAEQALSGLVNPYDGRGKRLPSTPSRGPNPSLMLGVAGVGYTLLRSLEPNLVPSILWPGGMLFDARPGGIKN